MAVLPPTFHHLRCERVGSVTVAVATQEAFSESTHPDDWTPFLTDAATNRELGADLATLAAIASGAVVLDLRSVHRFLGDALGLLSVFAQQMIERGKSLAICAAPPLVEMLEVTRMTRMVPCCADLLTAVERATAGQ